MEETLHEFKGEKLKTGQYLFNKCFPETFPIVKGEIRKPKLKQILNYLVLNYPPAQVIETLDKIKQLGFTQATLQGFSLGMDDLYFEDLEVEASKLTGNVEQDMTHMASPELMSRLKQLPASIYIESGARGSWDQAKQLVFSRGYVSDAKGKIIPNLIRSSLSIGLNQDEYFDSCWGARKGLLDTALSTGDSGYLTRQLIYSTVHIELGETEDCETTDYLSIEVKDEKFAKCLLWRYHMTETGLQKIKINNYKSLIGKTIKLRSPIYCKTKGICKKCYGDLHRILHSDQIGIIATQAVGERITQLVLRTFHTSGVAQASEQFDKQEDIIGGMTFANKVFHSPESVLEDVLKPEEHVLMIYKIFSQYKAIHMVHYEIITSAMMWVDNLPWRLCDTREQLVPEWVSILKVPSRSSWLLGTAFSNLKSRLLYGLIHDTEDNNCALTDLFRL